MPTATSGGRHRDRRRTELRLQLFRRHAHQDAQLDDRLPPRDLQLGDLGLGLLQRAAGLVRVALGARAARKRASAMVTVRCCNCTFCLVYSIRFSRVRICA